jgi:hypothetical protein
MINKTPAHLPLTGFSIEKTGSNNQLSQRALADQKYNPGPIGKAGTHWISFVNTLREVY